MTPPASGAGIQLEATKKPPFQAAFLFSATRPSQGPEIADTGQLSTQAPQSTQVAGEMTRAVPSLFSLMASTGQVGSQAPQLIQSSLIECAIFLSFLRKKV